MSVLKKLASMTQSSGSKLVKRYFPTVRSIEPHPGTAGIIQGLGLDSLAIEPPANEQPPKHHSPKTKTKVSEILQEVKAIDGLPQNPSHVEHIIGRATKGKIYQKHLLQQQSTVACNIPLDLTKTQEKYEVGGIDIAEKTQLILQSSHPVRYVIER